MKCRVHIILGFSLLFLWAATEGFAGRGGGGGGGRGGGGGGRAGGGGARPAGGGARPAGGGARPGGGMPAGGRTPSFSQPSGGGGRATQLPQGGRPSVGSRPSQLPSGRPDIGSRPSQLPAGRPEIGSRPTQLPSSRPDIGSRPSQLPGGGNRPSTLPSTRPDLGAPGIGTGRGPGISTLPAAGIGAAVGAGLGNRPGDRPATLPGLGDRAPGAGQLPTRTPEQRRDALNDRLGGEGPARDGNQVRQDWQQQRDQIREDWQQHRDEARDDWQDWFGDHYGRYGGWYLGYASGYWGRWDHLWDNYPVAAAVGLTWWGANSLGYMFGCSDYSNPYYDESMPAYYAEPVVSAPIEIVQEPAGSPASGASNEGVVKFDQARAAFFEGKYEDALKLTDAAVVLMARDAVLHEFRSLVLFALQRYRESAAALHPVLAVGPGWDWKTLSGLYPSLDVYTEQLRALEDARDKNPEAADLRFLLGYHYLTCRHEEAALKSFRLAAELQPKDTVLAALVASLSPRDAAPAQPPATESPKTVPTEKLVGAWKAAGPKSAAYTMHLSKDGTFTWSYHRGQRKQEAKGVYALKGNVLAMEPDTGGVLAAELTAKGPDTVLFKMIGGSPGDQGLEFQREPSK